MRSPICWMGGKSRQLKTLLPLVPEHNCYVEVFGGAGWLLFGNYESIEHEVLYTITKDVSKRRKYPEIIYKNY